MVQAPSFLTLAEQEVRRLRSRSVAVMESLSSAASNKKLERIGMVVLRSTTPCVAVSSLSNSDLLTDISIVDVPAAVTIASAGINTTQTEQARAARLLVLLLYQKQNHINQ